MPQAAMRARFSKRAQRLATKDRTDEAVCVRPFGKKDLLTEVLYRFVPTSRRFDGSGCTLGYVEDEFPTFWFLSLFRVSRVGSLFGLVDSCPIRHVTAKSCQQWRTGR